MEVKKYKTLLFLLSFLIASLSQPLIFADATPEVPVSIIQLSNDSFIDVFDAIMDSNRTFHVVYSVTLNGSQSLYYTTWSPHELKGWKSTKITDNSSVNPSLPSIAIDDSGNLYVVWMDKRLGQWDIYFSYLKKGRDAFSQNILLNIHKGDIDNKYPLIACSRSRLHVAWYAYNGSSEWSLLYTNSSYLKYEFGDPVEVARSYAYTLPSTKGWIGIGTNGSVHILWVGAFIHHEIQSNGTFSEKKDFSVQSPEFIDACFLNGTLNVVWNEAGQINYGEVYSNGSTTEERVYSQSYSFFPSISVDMDKVPHITWEYKNNSHLIFYSKQNSDGFFSSPVKIVEGDDIGCPLIFVVENQPIILFKERNRIYATMYKIRPPLSPVDLSTSLSNLTLNLSWLPPSDDGNSIITEYKIYRGTSPNSEEYLASVNGSVTYYIDSNITEGTIYYYRISAVNGVGESNLSEEVSIQIPEIPSSAWPQSTLMLAMSVTVLISAGILVAIFRRKRRAG